MVPLLSDVMIEHIIAIQIKEFHLKTETKI